MSAGQVDDELLIAIRAELAPFREAIGKLPQMAGAEGDKIRAALNRAISADKMAAELNKIRNVAEKTKVSTSGLSGVLAKFGETARTLNSNTLISQLESIGSLGITVGGNVSRMAMTFTTAVRPVATLGTVIQELAPGLLGIAATAATIVAPIGLMGAAFAVAGGQAQASAEQIGKLADELDKAARSGDKDAARRLQDYAEGIEAVRAREAILERQHRATEDALLSQGQAVAAQAAGWDRISGSLSGYGSAVWSAFRANVGINSALMGLGSSAIEAEVSVERLRSSMAGLGAEGPRLRAAAEQQIAETQWLADENNLYRALGLAPTPEEDREADRKRQEAERLRAQAIATARRETEAAARDRARFEWDAAVLSRKVAEDTATDAKRIRDQELREETSAAEERKRLAWSVYEEEQRILDEARRAHAEKLQVQADYAFGLVQTSMSAVSSLVTQGTQYTIDSFETRRDAGLRYTEEEEAHYKRALHDRRVMAITEIVTQAAVAYAGMVAQLAPSLGPAAPALAALSVGAGVIAPLAQLLGESIPWGISGSADDGESSAPVDVGQAWQNAGQGFANPFAPRGGSREDDTSRRARGGATLTLDRRTARLRVIQDPPGKWWGNRR